MEKIKQQEESIAQISEIHSMMEQSSRFISLSGISGIVAGLTALVGATLAYIRLGFRGGISYRNSENGLLLNFDSDLTFDLILIFLSVLVIALLSGFIFTRRKAKKKGLEIWDSISKRMLANLLIPLGTGGLFCMVLVHHEIYGLIGASTLIFYGLALINASKYTLNDIRYLGICQIILGIISTFFIGYGLFFWAFGFGILHIAYGAVMYQKYDRD